MRSLANKLPLLESLCWNIAEPYALSEMEMLSIYEQNWRFKGLFVELDPKEAEFIQYLTTTYRGLPLVNSSFPVNKNNLYSLIEIILSQINHELLLECGVFLGGGALVNLKYSQFRYSQDLDFLCNKENFYRFRQQITRSNQNLFQNNASFKLNPARIDRYAIRFPIYIQYNNNEEVAIKVEFVLEDSLNIDSAQFLPNVRVPCLRFSDLVAAKLLANYDRGLDKSKFSRDLIDLAVLRTKKQFPQLSYDKATNAYQLFEDISISLANSITFFQEDDKYREKCYRQLQIDRPVEVIDGLDLLAQDLGLPITSRTFIETDFSYLD